MMEVQQQFVEEIDFNELIFSEVVGRGAFGVVHRALWRNANVAVKLIETESERKAFITELKQLSRISHPNIVRLYGACTKQPVCLVMEYAEGGSLYNVLHCAGPQVRYTAAHALSWALQCARGVEYLHGMKPKPLIHRDLKPPNLLLVNGGTKVKICDFGTACDAHTHMTNNKGSAAWMAPEVFEGCNYSEKCDVFSWGIILWEVITRHKPFDEIGGSAFRVMWAVHSGKRPPLIRNCPKPLQNLMSRCWSAVPSERPSMSEVVRLMSRISQFFRGENEPLFYPARSNSDETVYRDGTYMTPPLTGQAMGSGDSRSSTVMQDTMQHQESVIDGDIVRPLLPVTSARKPLVIEDSPLAFLAQSENSSDADKSNHDAALRNSSSTANNTHVESSQPFVKGHRRTGSHGTPPVTVAQQPFVPGHRRGGSHGNMSAITAAMGATLLPPADSNSMPRLTTAPGNLEDINTHMNPNINNALRSVSWAPESTWTSKPGSIEDVEESAGMQSVLSLIDPQLRPLPPCSTSPESVAIFQQHIQLLDDYMKLQAEVAQYEQRKKQLINELEVDEKERLNRMKEEYTSLLSENDQLKLLYRNLQTQVRQINQSTSPTADDCSWRRGSR